MDLEGNPEKIQKILSEWYGVNAPEVISVMTGDNRYEEILLDKKGVSSMCDVAQRLENRGITKGEAKGEAKLAKLMSLLLEKGLVADATKAATDEKTRQEMYKKYGI